jgi:hypothetical protein
MHFFGYYKHGTTFFQSFIRCFDNKIASVVSCPATGGL